MVPLLVALGCAAPLATWDNVSAATSALKESIFADYDFATPPPGPAAGAGVEVQLGLNIYQIEDIDVAHGTMVLHAWLRLEWLDARLSWNSSDWGGVEQMTAHGAKPLLPGPKYKTWVPDVELYNGASSVYDVPHKDVMISSDGTVFWSRPGKLKVLCSFTGLQNFPTDLLTCTLKFGGWSFDDRAQNLTFYSDPVVSENIPDVSFLEYEIKGITYERGVERWACCPGGWPFLLYTFTITRHLKYYIWKIVAINAMLTFLSFGVFFTHPRAINRQHFSSTMLLTVITFDIFVDSLFPMCKDVLWMELFMFVSFLMTLLLALGREGGHARARPRQGERQGALPARHGARAARRVRRRQG